MPTESHSAKQAAPAISGRFIELATWWQSCLVPVESHLRGVQVLHVWLIESGLAARLWGGCEAPRTQVTGLFYHLRWTANPGARTRSGLSSWDRSCWWGVVWWGWSHHDLVLPAEPFGSPGSLSAGKVFLVGGGFRHPNTPALILVCFTSRSLCNCKEDGGARFWQVKVKHAPAGGSWTQNQGICFYPKGKK